MLPLVFVLQHDRVKRFLRVGVRIEPLRVGLLELDFRVLLILQRLLVALTELRIRLELAEVVHRVKLLGWGVLIHLCVARDYVVETCVVYPNDDLREFAAEEEEEDGPAPPVETAQPWDQVGRYLDELNVPKVLRIVLLE